MLNLFLYSALSLHDWTHTVLQTRLHYHLGAALILTAPCTALEGTHLQKIKWHCSSFALMHEYTLQFYCISCGKLSTHHYWEGHVEQIENLLLLCMVTAQFTVFYASLASQTRPTRGSLVHGEETRLERNSLHATGSLAEAVWKSGSARLTCETHSMQVVWETGIWRWVAVLT